MCVRHKPYMAQACVCVYDWIFFIVFLDERSACHSFLGWRVNLYFSMAVFSATAMLIAQPVNWQQDENVLHSYLNKYKSFSSEMGHHFSESHQYKIENHFIVFRLKLAGNIIINSRGGHTKAGNKWNTASIGSMNYKIAEGTLKIAGARISAHVSYINSLNLWQWSLIVVVWLKIIYLFCSLAIPAKWITAIITFE